jgi:hypothetical protein
MSKIGKFSKVQNSIVKFSHFFWFDTKIVFIFFRLEAKRIFLLHKCQNNHLEQKYGMIFNVFQKNYWIFNKRYKLYDEITPPSRTYFDTVKQLIWRNCYTSNIGLVNQVLGIAFLWKKRNIISPTFTFTPTVQYGTVPTYRTYLLNRPESSTNTERCW